jgi:hypothetical protein
MDKRLLLALKIAQHSLTTIGVLTGIVLGYNQLRIWQTEGKSYMGELLRISLTVAFAICILGGGVFHYLARRVAKTLSGNAAKNGGLDVQIESAAWGNDHSRVSVLATVNAMRPNALTFHVDPHTLNCDPAPGVDQKYIDVTYVFPGRPKETIRRMQGQWVTLPEDQGTKFEMATLSKDMSAKEKELEGVRERLERYFKAYPSNLKMTGESAVLFEYAANAKDLFDLLETVWHHWSNEGHTLIHPLSSDALRKEIKDWSGDGVIAITHELQQFWTLYRNHIALVRSRFPKFTSQVMTTGYPSEDEYVVVRRNLQRHQELLSELAEGMFDAASVVL